MRGQGRSVGTISKVWRRDGTSFGLAGGVTTLWLEGRLALELGGLSDDHKKSHGGKDKLGGRHVRMN